MNVLQICQDYYNTDLYKNLFHGLDSNIYNVIFTPLNIKQNKVIKKTENYEVCAIPVFKNKDKYLFYRKQNKIYQKLIENVDITKVDIVHSHTLFTSGNIAYNIKMQYGKKYIVAVRGSDVNTFLKYRIGLRKRAVDILLNAEKIIFLSKTYKNIVLDKYIPRKFNKQIENKSLVIPNGINNLWFENNNLLPKKFSDKEINIIQVARLDKNKNHYTTIKAIKRLRGKGINVKLHLVGDGVLKEKIVEVSNKNKDFISYYGSLTRNEIKKLYEKMDIFVMPSKYETFGLVYVESISQGVPVIYTKEQGFDGYFNEGDVGYPVKYNDYNEIVDRILDIVKKYEGMSKECILKSKRFSWHDISNQYSKIYNELYEE